MLTSGQVVGEKYKIDRVIGRGGMGVVYAARHVLLDELVALKVIAPEIAHEGALSTRFVREARAASKIRSEHVVRVTDVGVQDDGTLYMAMELLEGCDLERLIRQFGPLREADAAHYVLQALVALGEAHALGMVHRDLKPANLFLSTTPDGQPIVKILDFGISKLSDAGSHRITTTDAIIGSPTYMSPEQLRGSKALDHRADIWSMGVVLFELLTAQLPFVGESAGAVFAEILQTSAPSIRTWRPDASARVEAIVARCLEKEAVARFGDVAELAQELAPLAPSGDVWADRVRRSIARVASSSGAVAPTEGSQHEALPTPLARAGQHVASGEGTAAVALESATTLAQAVGEAATPMRTKDGHALLPSPAVPVSPLRAAGIGALSMLVIGGLAIAGWIFPSRLMRRSVPAAADTPSVAALTSSPPVASIAASSEAASPAPPMASPLAPSAPPAPSVSPARAPPVAPSGAVRPHVSDERRRATDASAPSRPLDPFPDQRK